jgi:hypothetical protein
MTIPVRFRPHLLFTAGLLAGAVSVAAVSVFGKPPAVSPAILSITQPVMAFSGTITSVAPGQLTVSWQPQAGAGGSGDRRPLSYRVRIDETLPIVKMRPFVPYLLKPRTGSGQFETVSVGNLTTDQTVAVYTREDLRTVTGSTVTASRIVVSPDMTVLTGVVTAASPTQLEVDGTVSWSPQYPGITQEGRVAARYTVHLTPETELSRPTQSASESASGKTAGAVVAPEDIKPGMPVVVFAAADIRAQPQITAQLVTFR